MKVSIIGVKGYPIVYGGYETLIKSLADRLKNKGIELTIYCHAALFKNKPTQVDGVRLVYLPAIEKKSLSQLTHSLLSTIHACFSSADIIFYVNVANAPFGFMPRIFGKKTVINVDGLEWLRPKWKGLGSVYFKFCAKLVKYFFNSVITDAVEMQRIYQVEFHACSKVITYGAENPNEYFPEMLGKYGIKERGYYLVVGRMIPDNNLDLIIEEYLNSGSNKKLVIIGDDFFKGSFAQSIEKKITGNQHIVLTGYINNHDELCTFYKYCFAYIHGHEYGGTNPTMIAALRENAFILALETPFTREMLDHGYNGIFFSKQKKSMADLLKKVENISFELEAENVRMKGGERVQQQYNWDNIANQYDQLFKGLLKKIK